MKIVSRRLTARVMATLFALAVLLSAAGIAFASISPKAGAYKGATNQGKQVTFKVVGKKVKNPQFTIEAGPCTGTFYIYDTAAIDSGGSFSISSVNAEFRGKFTSKRAVRGTATGEFSSCPAGTKTVTYRAHR